MPEQPAAGSDGLDDREQRAWDAIVADLSGQVDLGPAFRPATQAPAELSPPAPVQSSDDGDRPEDEWLFGGYEPPEPPAIPRPQDTVGKAAWAGVLGGPALIVLTWVLGWETWITGLGVAATVAGLAALIARMPGDRDDDPGDGAVV